MDVSGPPPALAELLAHAGWARALARQLVGDAARAEELVQDTLGTALDKPPRRAGNLRGWLARVLTNAARQRQRAEDRRVRREAGHARPEALPSAAELAQTVELQRSLATHLLALEEPYRSTLILRFYRDLSPKAIAAAQGVPAATDRSRLMRGLEL
jgi:RNA polymerase sigma-70 factor (ECF subfamily)